MGGVVKLIGVDRGVDTVICRVKGLSKSRPFLLDTRTGKTWWFQVAERVLSCVSDRFES